VPHPTQGSPDHVWSNNLMPEPSRRESQSPKKAQTVLTVIVRASGELEFGLSPRDGDYGKHMVAKIKGPTQGPTPYRCRAGAVVQFRDLTGQPLGYSTPIVELEIITQKRNGGSLRYLVSSDSLRGIGGTVVPIPTLTKTGASKVTPSDTPIEQEDRMDRAPSKPTSSSVNPPQSLRELKSPPIPVEPSSPSVTSPAASVESSASGVSRSPKSGMVPADPAVEKFLREALLRENSDLHEKIRRSNHAGAIRTWVDGYLEIAQSRLKTSPTPMAHMAQVFLNPAYLKLKHADPGKAAETVMMVAAFFDLISKSSPAPLKKFARELLKKHHGDTNPKEDKTVLGKRAPTPEELLAKLEDSKSSNAILESMNRQLFSVVGRGVHAVRRIQTDVGKRDALKTLTAVLDASQKTKAYKSMSTEDRVRFDAEIAQQRGRIDSLKRSNGLSS